MVSLHVNFETDIRLNPGASRKYNDATCKYADCRTAAYRIRGRGFFYTLISWDNYEYNLYMSAQQYGIENSRKRA
jgi:hypothetical protein